jgi:ABC-2 type transport system permease protein
MSVLLRRAAGMLSVSYAFMVEYRAELILWALSNSLSFILMGAWYEATARGSFAMQPVDVLRYFIAVFVVRQLTIVWVIWELEQDVQKGKLSHFLTQPVDPAWRYVAAHVAERAARLPFSAVIVAAFFLLVTPARFVPAPMDVLLTLVFVVLAFTLRFLIQYTLGLTLFWTERATSIEVLMFVVYMFLSGAVAPLDVFPQEVRDVVMWTPFPYLIWLPARLLLGSEGLDVTRAFLICGGWIVGLFVINRIVWRRALRHHGAMGG